MPLPSNFVPPTPPLTPPAPKPMVKSTTFWGGAVKSLGALLAGWTATQMATPEFLAMIPGGPIGLAAGIVLPLVGHALQQLGIRNAMERNTQAVAIDTAATAAKGVK